MTIHQDVDIFATLLGEGDSVSHVLAERRKGWIHLAQGSAALNDEQLQAGDGVAVEGPATITLTGTSKAEMLLFDMA